MNMEPDGERDEDGEGEDEDEGEAYRDPQFTAEIDAGGAAFVAL